MLVQQEIHASLKEIAMDTYGRKVLLYLLCPRSVAHFHPKTVKLLEQGDGNTTRSVQQALLSYAVAC